MYFLTHFTIALSSLLAIVLACIFFTNAIERLGIKLNLNKNATGSILAVLGTGLPEVIVPIVAIIGSFFISKDLTTGQEIAIGAIFGSPFMLSTFALFILGVMFLYLVLKKKKDSFKTNHKNITRDFKYFILAFSIAFCAVFIDFKPIKILIGLSLICLYFIFALRTIQKSQNENDEEENIKLFFEKIFKKENNYILFSQIVISLVALVFCTHFFVEEIKYFSNIFNINPMITTLIVAPFATELPEITNSIIWLKQGKDELALSNIIGAVVFQAMILTSLGIFLTPWKFNFSILINATLTILCGLFFTLSAWKNKKITRKQIPIRITADLSIETLQARREWQDILKVMKEKNLQPRLLYPARISFRYEGEIKALQTSKS